MIVRYRYRIPETFKGVAVTEGKYKYKSELIDGIRYGVYTFTNAATVRLEGASFADVLLVGGGGGGGAYAGGGGGGGQVVYAERLPLVTDNYNIVVGEGGAGGECTGSSPSRLSDGGDGGTSVAFGLTAAGGGGGGTLRSGLSGANGGGGGVGSYQQQQGTPLSNAGGSSTDGIGFNGGASMQFGVHFCVFGGGGGGAGGAGSNAWYNADSDCGAGIGGKGVTNSITGVATGYGGGGGGGGGYYGTVATITHDGGGAGGAAPGAIAKAGNSGVDGLGGGGGGGGRYIRDWGAGGRGGCGVVVLRVREPKRGVIISFK